MEKLKYDELYLSYLMNELEVILYNIQEASITYYGESMRSKIEKTVNDIVVAFIVKNYSNLELKTLKDEAYNLFKFHLDNLNKDNKFTDDEIIKYALLSDIKPTIKLKEFRDYLLKFTSLDWISKKKIDSHSNNIFLGSNRGSFSDGLIDLLCSIPQNISGAAHSNTNHGKLIILRILRSGKISLHALIHEINHHLQKEELFILQDDNIEKIKRVTGITGNRYDLINELINEYSSQEIMKIFMSYYSSPLLDTKFSSGYLIMDKICDDTIKKIYEIIKPEIKGNLINGNANIIKKIIDDCGQNNYYAKLNGLFNYLQEKMIIADSKGETFEAFMNNLSREDREEYINFSKDIFHGVKDNCLKYQQIIEENIAFTKQLIKEGRARRIK